MKQDYGMPSLVLLSGSREACVWRIVGVGMGLLLCHDGEVENVIVEDDAVLVLACPNTTKPPSSSICALVLAVAI